MAKNGQRCCSFLKHILAFFALYSCLVLIVSHISARDPGSVFFDPVRAYEPRYSADRAKQADAFIKSAWLRSKTGQHHDSTSNTAPLCVGIKSITHERARSLRTTIGSLLQGLSAQERNNVHLKVLIAHVDPLVHPAVHEPWLKHTVDDVLFYNHSLSPKETQHLLELEDNPEDKVEAVQEKEVFDYTYLLKKCYESGSEYIAMLEDDVVAVDGWLHHSLIALEEAEEKTAVSDKWNDFLYLRLFYTEQCLSWSSEDRTPHVVWSLFGIGFVAATMYAVRILKPHSTVGRTITPLSMFWICCVVAPMLLLLYFSGGRLTMHPLPRGIIEMNEHGCCSQGLVYPRHQAGKLLEWYQVGTRVGSVSALTEQYADQNDQLRWAIVPSVLQHMGRKSSGGENSEDVNAVETAWSIEFEEYNVAQLKLEHEVVQRGERERQSLSSRVRRT